MIAARLQPGQHGGHGSFLTADDRLVWAIVVRDHDPVRSANHLGGLVSPAAQCGEYQAGNVQRGWVERGDEFLDCPARVDAGGGHRVPFTDAVTGHQVGYHAELAQRCVE